jgi:hypothetical protein
MVNRLFLVQLAYWIYLVPALEHLFDMIFLVYIFSILIDSGCEV